MSRWARARGLGGSAAALAAVLVFGFLLLQRWIDRQAEQTAAAKMKILGVAAASVPESAATFGAATVLRETRSSKYWFLNKVVYRVHTSTPARAGTELVPSDPDDRARGARHAEVLRTGRPILSKLSEDRRRFTAVRTAAQPHIESFELTATVVPFAGTLPLYFFGGGAIFAALGFGLLAFWARRDERAPWLALGGGALAWGAAAAAMLPSAASDLSLALTAYLGRALPTAVPPVRVSPVPAMAAILLLATVTAALGFGLASGPGRRLRDSVAAARLAWVFLAPATAALSVLVGIPFAVGLGMALFRHEHGHYLFVGLQNFVSIFRGASEAWLAPGSFGYGLVFTVLWTVSNVALHVGIGLCLALLLHRRAAGWARLYRVFLVLPWAVPAYLSALIWKAMFDPDVGAVNQFLGLDGFSWMNHAATAFAANLVTNVWLGFPFMMVVCLGALTSIPAELYEAAQVDGASSWEQFRRITLPLLRPALLPAVILGSIWTFNRFEVIYLVSEGRPDGATDILVTEAYKWAFERGLARGGAYGYAAAYSVVIFAVLMLYGAVTNRVARTAEEALR